MGKKNNRSNFRVEVYVRHPGDFGMCFISGDSRTEKQREKECQNLLDDIESHVDKSLVPSRGTIGSVVWDNEPTCEFCGAQWTEKTEHNGGCCDKDTELMNKVEN